jgi:hypothetical protein
LKLSLRIWELTVSSSQNREYIIYSLASDIPNIDNSYRIIYVILACRAKVKHDIGDFYESAYEWKVFELEALARCRGLKYPTARDVLRQLLNHAIECVQFGHNDVVVPLRNLLESCGSSLERINDGQGRVQLKALIRDGSDDKEEEIRSTLGYDMT